jgi:hypothetical protein
MKCFKKKNDIVVLDDFLFKKGIFTTHVNALQQYRLNIYIK